MSKRWTLPDFDKINYKKSFIIDGPLPLEVDYDDVWQPAVELQARYLVDILNANWEPIFRHRCINDDCVLAYDKIFQVADGLNCTECGHLLQAFKVEG